MLRLNLVGIVSEEIYSKDTMIAIQISGDQLNDTPKLYTTTIIL